MPQNLKYQQLGFWFMQLRSGLKLPVKRQSNSMVKAFQERRLTAQSAPAPASDFPPTTRGWSTKDRRFAKIPQSSSSDVVVASDVTGMDFFLGGLVFMWAFHALHGTRRPNQLRRLGRGRPPFTSSVAGGFGKNAIKLCERGSASTTSIDAEAHVLGAMVNLGSSLD